ncbi:collagen alpha-2(I) chain-like [Physella acuta]|uniref:collagen alpha-2(I) chain-like n=1 Tax=Physella acuta TaxID=109671 RepID=UPI0027DD8A0E|nr:collagen alpha-2(I) chain-like [Physella acuta]
MASIPRKASVNLLVSLISRSNFHRLARRSVHGLFHGGKIVYKVRSGAGDGVTPLVAGHGVMTYSCRAGDCRTFDTHDCKVKPKFLLGIPYDETKHDPSGWWMSEKLDGVRVMWDGRSVRVTWGEGQSGSCGMEGQSGQCGVKGQSGPRGVEGQSGQCGVKGQSGSCGMEGPCGMEGQSGPCGMEGHSGSCGVKGMEGQSGPCGMEGQSGQCGMEGQSGPCGI